MPALSINGVAVTGGVANLSNSNNVTFGLTGSSLTASVSHGQVTMSQWPPQVIGFRFPTAVNQHQVTVSSGARITYAPMPLPFPLSVNAAFLPYYLSTAGAATSATSFTAGTSFAVGIYSLTGTTLTSVSTGAWALTCSYASGSCTFGTFHSGGATSTTSYTHQTLASNAIGGYRAVQFTQFAGSLPAGNYWLGVWAGHTIGNAAFFQLWTPHTFPFQSTNDAVGSVHKAFGTSSAVYESFGSISAALSGSMSATRGSTIFTSFGSNEFPAIYLKVTM